MFGVIQPTRWSNSSRIMRTPFSSMRGVPDVERNTGSRTILARSMLPDCAVRKDATSPATPELPNIPILTPDRDTSSTRQSSVCRTRLAGEGFDRPDTQGRLHCHGGDAGHAIGSMSSESLQVSGDSGPGSRIKAGDGHCYWSGAHFRVRAAILAFFKIFRPISGQKPSCQCMLRRWGFSRRRMTLVRKDPAFCATRAHRCRLIACDLNPLFARRTP